MILVRGFLNLNEYRRNLVIKKLGLDEPPFEVKVEDIPKEVAIRVRDRKQQADFWDAVELQYEYEFLGPNPYRKSETMNEQKEMLERADEQKRIEAVFEENNKAKNAIAVLTKMRDDIAYDAASFRMSGLGSETLDDKVIALQIAINTIDDYEAKCERLADAERVIAYYGDKSNWHGHEQENMWDVYFTASSADAWDKAHEYLQYYAALKAKREGKDAA
jgi:hypothetical protein